MAKLGNGIGMKRKEWQRQERKSKMSIKAYKGFNKDMTCKGFQFKEGETYHENEAELCEKGFHACTDPMDCFDYYNPAESVFHKVELDDVTGEKSSDSKICGKTIKIGARLGVAGIVKATIDLVFNSVKKSKGKEEASGDGSKLAASGNGSNLAASGNGSNLAASGDYSKLAASGDYSKLAASGNGSNLAASGYCSKLAASGYYSKLAASGNGSNLAASGDYSNLVASGNYSNLAASGDGSNLAASGDYSKLAASGNGSNLAASGDYSKLAASGDGSNLAASGDCSNLVASGDCSKLDMQGERSIAMCAGNNCKARGKMGDWIVLTEWERDRNDTLYPKFVKAGKITNKALKPDTWYCLRNGKFVEVDDESEE